MPVSYKPAFVLNARNKGKHVYAAAAGALAQTYPCEILLSDQHSSDNTYQEMERAVAQAPRGHPEHEVRLVRCPVEGKYGMAACNAHFDWCVAQTKATWVFQCSADDYSLPDRVKVCMDAAMRNKASAIACWMYFQNPQTGAYEGRSGFPEKTGYVNPGEGLVRMAYGSTIHAFHRTFLEKVGGAGDVTLDVYYGFLAALDHGFYVVADAQHVHGLHADPNNMGFQGKMRGASGDELARLNELNHYQLCKLYHNVALKAQNLYPMAHLQDQMIPRQMMMDHAAAWIKRRDELHEKGIVPGVL